MELKLSPSVENYLYCIAKERDDLINENNLNIETSEKKPNRISKAIQERIISLKKQLPPGIYVNPNHIKNIIRSSIKRVNTSALKYSPFVLDYPEFKCCKPMKYRAGNIITGRDKEISDILLAFTKSTKRGTILVGEPGVGKAQPINSKVLTPLGWTKIKDLKIGDSVICPDNTVSKILGIFPQGYKTVNEITFSDNRKAECCNEHLWKIYSKNLKKTGSVVSCEFIKHIKKHTDKKLYIDLVKPLELSSYTPEIDPYIIGVLIGNNSFFNDPVFIDLHKHIIDKIECKLNKGYRIYEKFDGLNVNSRIVNNDPLEKNIYTNYIYRVGLNNKNRGVYIPHDILTGSIKTRSDVLQGLIDSHGIISKNGNLSYSTKSKQLCNNIVWLIQSLGGIANVVYDNETLYYDINIKISNLKYYITLQKKVNKVKNNNLNLKLEITDVKELGEKECACIYIDHPEHLYVTDDFIVTHNTALVRAVNNRLIERNVPRQLNGCYILNLDVPWVFSNFKEDPTGAIIKVLERASVHDKVILFIDEVHQLLGHKMNDIMKPYLTEKIRFIGSTTIDEYHSIITDDKALERRFTLIPVDEPNIERTINMITGTKEIYENYHKCIIPDDVCKYAVINGSRFLGHRKNPDKSLDLLDIACSILYEKEIKNTESELIQTTEQESDVINNLDIIKTNIRNFKEIAGERVLSEDYINLAISSITGINFGEIKNSLNYSQVFNNISDKIIGQQDQVKSLSNVVNIFKHVKTDRNRPVSIVLVVGPEGCGKSTACKLLGKQLYGKEEHFIDYDMSGLTSEFQLTELKGAPPGYVGYGKSGKLVKQVRNSPQSIIYFRNINKSHPVIKQYVIDSCRTGMLTDSSERQAPLNNAVIVYSVTLNNDQYESLYNTKKKTMGFSKETNSKEDNYNDEVLKQIVGDEIVKAVDEIIIFNKLDQDTLKQIFNSNVDEYLEMYNVDIDKNELETIVLKDSKNGKDIISKLASEVPKLVFNKLKQE